MAVMEKSKKKELLKFVSRDDLKKADDIPSRYINKSFCVVWMGICKRQYGFMNFSAIGTMKFYDFYL